MDPKNTTETESFKNQEKKNTNDSKIPLNTIKKKFIYLELLFLFFLCCANNFIIRKKKESEEIKIYRVLHQIGRIIGAIAILIYFNFKRNLKYIEWFIFCSILLKSVFLFTYFINLFFFNRISTFFQGFFHSLIDIYFPIWINQFFTGKTKLFLLSISRTSVFFGNFLEKLIEKEDYSFQFCNVILIIIIVFFDSLFILTVKIPFKNDKTNPIFYLNLTITPIEEEQNEKNIKRNNKYEEEFVFNDEKIKECE